MAHKPRKIETRKSIGNSYSSYVCINICLRVRRIVLKYRLKYLMLESWKVVGLNPEDKLKRTLINFLYLSMQIRCMISISSVAVLLRVLVARFVSVIQKAALIGIQWRCWLCVVGTQRYQWS